MEQQTIRRKTLFGPLTVYATLTLEPATLAILGLGVLGAAVVRRRKK